MPKKKTLKHYKLAALLVFAVVASFGLSALTFNMQQSNVGNSGASSQFPSDINSDGIVDLVDLSILLSDWNKTTGVSDLDVSGKVDIADLSILLSNWNKTAPVVPPADQDTNFSIIVMPDTQQETSSNPDLFNKRMDWVVQNKAAKDIRFVVQVGDLINWDNCGPGSLEYLGPNNTRPRCDASLRAQNVFYPMTSSWAVNHYQYINADTGLKNLEAANVPYSLAVGNHDTAAVCGGPACVGANPDWTVPSGTTTNQLLRSTGTWNNYFPQTRVKNVDSKGFYEAGKSDNYYQTFSAGGLKWLVLSLELWPRTEVINWAKTVVSANPNYNVIVNTHHYLNGDGSISTSNGGYGNNSPKYLYDNLIKLYSNIKLVHSGHLNTTAHRVDTGVNGNKIHSILDCYHDGSNNQTRIMEIDTKNNSIVSKVMNNVSNPTNYRSDGNINISDIAWVR